MNFGKILLCTLSVGIFSFSCQAQSLTDELLNDESIVQDADKSMTIAREDWPEAHQKVIRHCLKEVLELGRKKPGMTYDQRVHKLDECATRWTTVGTLKNQYTE